MSYGTKFICNYQLIDSTTLDYPGPINKIQNPPSFRENEELYELLNKFFSFSALHRFRSSTCYPDIFLEFIGCSIHKSNSQVKRFFKVSCLKSYDLCDLSFFRNLRWKLSYKSFQRICVITMTAL